MIVDVVGVKHIGGISKKTNKEFDAYVIPFTRPGAPLGYDGLHAGELYCPTEKIRDGRVPMIGDKLLVDVNVQGYVESVDFID